MKAQVISFHCVLRNITGKVLSSTFNQDVITESPSPAAPLKELAQALNGIKKGEKRKIFLKAAQAYGYYDPKLVMEMPRTQIDSPTPLAVGAELFVREADGTLKPWRVVSLTGTKVVLDGNHPLAGQDLEFEIETTSARPATPDELIETPPLKPGAWLN